MSEEIERDEAAIDNRWINEHDDDIAKEKSTDDQDEKKPNKKRAKSSRVKLDAFRLCGPRGLHEIPEIFKNFKPRGKGYEFDDLNVVMTKLEHWAHRLYPQMTFDDVLARVEALGPKKLVQITLEQIRDKVKRETMARDEFRVEPVNADPELEEENAMKQENETYQDDINDSINHKDAPSLTSIQNEPDDIIAESSSVVSMEQNAPMCNDLNEEQKRRIEENRRRAMELRRKRMEGTIESPTILPDPITDKSEQNGTSNELDIILGSINSVGQDLSMLDPKLPAADSEDILMTDDDVLDFISTN